MAKSKVDGYKRKRKTTSHDAVAGENVEKTDVSMEKIEESKDSSTDISTLKSDKIQNMKKIKSNGPSKKERAQGIIARKALATGELAAENEKRNDQRDRRTLYVRFEDNEKAPENEKEVKNLHADIQIVRIHDRKKTKEQRKIKYVLLEFGSEAKCEEAKVAMEKDDGLYVDYVGNKSLGKTKIKKKIIPSRLFVTGLPKGMSREVLQNLFPKSKCAKIPTRSKRNGGLYGFVDFENPADAKSAFDGANKLTMGIKGPSPLKGQHIEVMFATTKIDMEVDKEE